MAREFTVTDGVVKGREGVIPIRDYVPVEPGHSTPFLWVHGGGFIYGGLDQKESDAPARWLAAAGWRVRTLDYRLAPNIGLVRRVTLGPAAGRFPAPHHDVLDVAEALVRDAGSPIAIGGASAGANLVAGAVLAMRDAATPLPLSVVLVYGALHSVLPDDTAIESALRGLIARWFFNPAMTRRMYLNYVGDESALENPYAFPGGADLTGFPPTLTLDAGNDRLRRSGHAFHRELAEAGVVTEEQVVDARHGFLAVPKGAAFATGMDRVDLWLSRSAAHVG